jgi:hypothetical protein
MTSGNRWPKTGCRDLAGLLMTSGDSLPQGTHKVKSATSLGWLRMANSPIEFLTRINNEANVTETPGAKDSAIQTD